MEPLFCPACGKPNGYDANYCSGCAKPLYNERLAGQPPAPEGYTPTTPPHWYPQEPIHQPNHQPMPPAQIKPGLTPQQIKWITIGLSIFGVLFVISLIQQGREGGVRTSSGSTPAISTPAPAPAPKVEMDAAVKFTGTQFVITNNNSFDWRTVKLEINGGIFSGGYELRVPVMTAGQTYTVGALQFADSDGKRFNPYQMKPQKFLISADTPSGHLVYVGGWN